MNAWTLVRRSLRFHARSHLGAVLGAAVGSAVLIGALVVGDSVRGSLRDTALERLAGAHLAMETGDRFFTTALFDRMVAFGLKDTVRSENPPSHQFVSSDRGSWPGAVLLRLPATVTRQDDSARANRVALYGVDGRFMRRKGIVPDDIPKDKVWLNEALAGQLNAMPGDDLVLRVHKPSALSRDAVIVPRDDASVALRLKVGGIIHGQPGDFSLTPGQAPPLNAFISIDVLGEAAAHKGMANLLVTGRNLPRPQTLLDEAWSLADAELEMRVIPAVSAQTGTATETSTVELRTPRIFLDPTIEKAALNPASGRNAPERLNEATNGFGVLTYLVNEIRAGDRTTPYSMIAALAPPGVLTNLEDDQILINDWLADDLKIGPGDPVALSYYVLDAGARLIEQTNVFRVAGVVPMRGIHGDATLMPEFPGLSKAESTHDWDAGFKLVHEIRAKDEEYWKKHRGTPKAFVTLAAGQKMWANRFGNLTSIRWPTQRDSDTTSISNLTRNLRANLRPESLGFQLEPVRERALTAAEQSQDFGGLFLGFSFFLIVAALLLMALLFQFGVEQRAIEVGTLLALGFTPKRIRRLLLLEGGVLAFLGGLIGVAGGIGYARVMLFGLSTVWREAIGASVVRFHFNPSTLVIGVAASTIIAWVTIWLTVRRQARHAARELLAEGMTLEERDPKSGRTGSRTSISVGSVAVVLGLSLIAWMLFQGDTANAEMFFSSGALLLISGLAFSSAYLTRLRKKSMSSIARFSLGGLGVRNCARRRTRSLSTLGLLACGIFLIASIGVFRLDAIRDAARRSSGTGGFALIGESTVPVVQDLNEESGREFFGLSARDLPEVKVVPLRVRDGDEASCLNLNRAQKPRLLGVKPESLAQRGAFTFAKVADDLPKEKGWMLLKEASGKDVRAAEPDVVPAIGDQNSILWAMGRKVGDTLDYTDEHGRSFKIRIVGAVANSILQGSLLIDEDAFVRLFPSESGYRMFLIDAPSNDATRVSATLTRALRDTGLELTPTTTRLAGFNAVQNTYLGTFQVLGGLGLLLGSVGLGVVVLRNVLERRGELAVMLAVGFRSSSVNWLVMSEHGALVILGFAIGILSALVAVMPALLSPGMNVPYASLSLTMGAVLINGAGWAWVASRAALRGRLTDALRDE